MTRHICTCPVCNCENVSHLATISDATGDKKYWKCGQCRARFLDRQHLPSSAREHGHYLHHQNDIEDPQYRKFLRKLAAPLLARLAQPGDGLDYGCGPGPALAAMLEEAGHTMSLYDPYFYPDRDALKKFYDFIACTETAEHFFHPADEFDRLNDLLRPGGILAMMTCFQTDDDKFAQWHYRRDPTHVVFYREATFKWLADHYGWSCEIPTKDVVLMQKSR